MMTTGVASVFTFALIFVSSAVQVRYGDPSIDFQHRRNPNLGTGQIEENQGSSRVQIVSRGHNGAVSPAPTKFDENGFATANSRSGRARNLDVMSIGSNVNVTSTVDGTGSPPPHDQVAKMARYIVKTANWTSIATISTRPPMVGYPCASVFAVSDGPIGKSTGVPYMFVTALDLSVQDLQVNPKTSLTMSLAQTGYCLNNKLDPEDPRCAHVILTGKFVKLENGTEEDAFAQQSLFSKHAVMATWPKDHHFFFAKLDIKNILVLDYFGGAKTVSPKEYFRARLYE